MNLFIDQQEHSPPRVALAKKLLANPDAHAAALLAATRIVLGHAATSYEFETIRKGFNWHGIAISQDNYDRLFSAISLLINPVFCWDAHTFGATIRAFAGENVLPEVMEPAPPVYIGWGIREAAEITNSEFNLGTQWIEDKLDGEVLEFIVGSLHAAGFCVAPRGLEWTQPYLEQALDSTVLTRRVQKKWDSLAKEKLADLDFEEDEVGVQLARLAGCYLYYRGREVSLSTQLAALLAV